MCMGADHFPVEKPYKKIISRSRKKLWQLDGSFHCSIIGTCLSLQELRELCQKLRITVQGSLTDYELHHSFVGIAAKSTYAARRLQKYLDQKYQAALRRFAGTQTDKAFKTHWREAVESGELAGAYWALVTHPLVSEALRDQAYGEVHMLSHLAGAAVRIDMQELNRLQRLSKKLPKQLADVDLKSRTKIAELDAEICQLHMRLAQAQAVVTECNDMRERLSAMENEPLLLNLKEQVEDSAAKLTAARARSERAEADTAKWKQMAMSHGDRQLQMEGKLGELRVERDALETTLENLIAPECTDCEQQDACSDNLNLRGRCILYVGGRSRQCANFRTLVERQNGYFIHHDGGLHDGRLRLGSILSQADAVFCPLDCVSHDAANRVKQFCKRHEKKLVLLPRSSLAAFTRGLNDVA